MASTPKIIQGIGITENETFTHYNYLRIRTEEPVSCSICAEDEVQEGDRIARRKACGHEWHKECLAANIYVMEAQATYFRSAGDRVSKCLDCRAPLDASDVEPLDHPYPPRELAAIIDARVSSEQEEMEAYQRALDEENDPDREPTPPVIVTKAERDYILEGMWQHRLKEQAVQGRRWTELKALCDVFEKEEHPPALGNVVDVHPSCPDCDKILVQAKLIDLDDRNKEFDVAYFWLDKVQDFSGVLKVWRQVIWGYGPLHGGFFDMVYRQNQIRFNGNMVDQYSKIEEIGIKHGSQISLDNSRH